MRLILFLGLGIALCVGIVSGISGASLVAAFAGLLTGAFAIFFATIILLWPLFGMGSHLKAAVRLVVWWFALLVLGAMARTVFNPEIVAARYSADAIPVIGTLRVKAMLYRYEKCYLPGIAHDATNALLHLAPAGSTISANAGTSHLGAGFLTQGFRRETDPTSGTVTYVRAMLGVVTNRGMHPGFVTLLDTHMANHFANHIHVDFPDLVGNTCSPGNFLYWCPVAAVKTNSYVYAFGAFGDGEGLPAGTGYAVLGVVNAALARKMATTWHRCKPTKGAASQIVFVSPDEDPGADPTTARDENYCWVPSQAALLTDDPKVFDAMIEDLKKAGWNMH